MSARDAIPMAHVRPAERHRGRPQSEERKAVEAVLRSATAARPVTPEGVAQRTGLDLSVARLQINKIVTRGMAYNLTPGGGRNGKYAWGADPATVRRSEPPPMQTGERYDGAELKPFQGRPGAMQAFTLPSLQNGESVPRKPPCIISAAPGGKAR